jgi:hypothetical protein
MVDTIVTAVVFHSVLVAAVALVGLGVLHTFGKELLWGWVRFRFSMVGLTPHRTARWDHWTTFTGVVCLIAGVALFIFVPSR